MGTYPIVASGASDNNYSFSYTDGELSIEKAPLTVTADDLTRIYGDPNPTLTLSYSGFVNGEDESVIDSEPIASTTADQTTDAGTVPIDVSGGDDNNYSFTYVSGTLTITQASATITLGSLTTTYNGLPQPVSATTIPAGLTVDFTYDGLTAIPVNANSYAVAASINDINYQGTSSGTLIINKAELFAAADDKTKIYGDANPPLTITYTGFVGTDDESVLDVPPTVTTTALQNSDAGLYPIVVSGGSDNNYSFSYTDGELSIEKATLTVTADDLTRIYGEPNPTLTLSLLRVCEW